jgi:hypothetical protein
LLYDSIVTDGLPTLLQGHSAYEGTRNRYTRPRSSKRKSKDELVSKTKTLRIAGVGLWCEPFPKLRFLLKNGDWSSIGTTEKQITNVTMVEIRRIIAITPESHHPPFASLEKLIIGQRSPPLLKRLEKEELDLLMYAQHRFDTFVTAHTPRLTCVHGENSHQPYTMLQASYVSTSRKKSTQIVTRHVYDEFSPTPINAGAKNRWISYPGALTKADPDVSLPELGMKLVQQIGSYLNMHEHSFGANKETSVDLYGLGMDGLGPSMLLPHKASIDDEFKIAPENRKDWAVAAQPEVQELKANAFNNRDILESNEEQFNHYIHEAMVTHLQEIKAKTWVNKIKFYNWRDSPECDCCGGWGPEVYREQALSLAEPEMLGVIRMLWG